MNPKDKLKEIEDALPQDVDGIRFITPLSWYRDSVQDIKYLLNRVKRLTEALEISLYTMRGSTSQLDLTISREELNYKEIRKGIEIARKALEESDDA